MRILPLSCLFGSQLVGTLAFAATSAIEPGLVPGIGTSTDVAGGRGAWSWLWVSVCLAAVAAAVGSVWRQAARRRRRTRFSHLLLTRLSGGDRNALIATDDTGGVAVYNPAAERLCGVPAGRVLKRGLEAFPPALTDWLRDHGLGALQSTPGGDRRERVPCGAQPHEHRVEQGPLLTSTGRWLGQYLAAHDVRAVPTTPQQARLDMRWYPLLFDANPQPMFVIDLQSLRFLAVNDATVAAYGYGRDELMAMRTVELDASPGGLSLQDALVGRAGRMAPLPLGIWPHRCKDGRIVQMELQGNALEREGRRACLILARDVGAQLSAERRLASMPQQLMLRELETTRRLSRRVHDDIGQSLALAQLHLAACSGALEDNPPAKLHEHLAEAAAQIEDCANRVREVLLDTSPASPLDQGLCVALRGRARAMQALLRAGRLRVDIADGVDRIRWPADVEQVAFSVAKEAAINAVRHARPTLVLVALQGGPSHLRLTVTDDGVGLPVQFRQGRHPRQGIVGMREKATSIGGHLRFSTRQPSGTVVSLRWQSQDHGNDLHH